MTAAPLDRAEPGYAEVARQFLDAGWAPLPLPRGQKASPPTGTTGADGKWPTVDDVDTWAASHHDGNVAIRMPTTVIGIDVDDYDDKGGGDTLARLEHAHGTLPPTWTSTSRGTGTSGIRLYRIPDGIRFPGVLGPGIDVIQHHHRYAVVTPSTHPNGQRYRLYDPSGNRATRPPNIDDLPALPQTWVDQLAERPATPIPDTPKPITLDGDDSVAERINRDHDWHSVLITDGWTISHQRGNDTHWTRPGKTGGTSAVLHEPDGPFVVFTTAVTALQQPWASNGDHWSYSMFGYLAATRHHGDRSGCARDYRLALNAVDTQYATLRSSTVAIATLDGATPDVNAHAHLVDWSKFWLGDHTEEDWLAYPLIPRGRSIALYAPAKAGKSTIVLSLVAALATGRDILGFGPSPAADVLYLDYEMTESDLAERLSELGYGPDDDLSRLHYALLPSLPPLDTPAGAQALLELADQVGADVVVVDTFGRAVEGDEDKADTVRNFYRRTGLALKAKGIAVLRTDHAGKDVERGQRGSSAKADDVDVVWSLKRTDNGVAMRRTHSRIAWGPAEIIIERHEQNDGTLAYRRTSTGDPPGTKEMVELLDRLGISPDQSARQATAAVRGAGKKCRNEVVRAAQRVRRSTYFAYEMPVDNLLKARPDSSGRGVDESAPQKIGARWGAPPQTLINQEIHDRGAVGRGGEATAPPQAPLYRGARAQPTPDDPVDNHPQLDPDDLF